MDRRGSGPGDDSGGAADQGQRDRLWQELDSDVAPFAVIRTRASADAVST
jgi:hypothetical protein